MPEDLNNKLTEHGRVASHPARTTSPLLVAPATTSEFNTLGMFERDHKLKVSGNLDAATKAKLKDVHGS